MNDNPLRRAWDMPWAIGFEIRRLLSFPFIRLMFALHGIRWGAGWKIWGMPMIQRYRGSRIEIGDGLLLRSWGSTNPLTPHHRVVLATRAADACIQIGKNVGMTGATIVAEERVEIGDGVLIGSNASILDTDFHPLTPEGRRRDMRAGKHAPVVIEKDVFIGMNVLILKGCRIGEGAVIGAGSVVTGTVPPQVIVAGNPARIIRQRDQESIADE